MKPRKCKKCLYKKKIATLGQGICSYDERGCLVNDEDYCHYLGVPQELTCGDCARLSYDSGCAGCREDESAFHAGHLCRGFQDRHEDDFIEILTFWLVHDMYDRQKIEKMLDEFEEESRKFCEEEE